MYTLLKSGVPRDHPAVRRGMAYVASREAEHTYALSCVILAMAAHAREQAAPGLEQAVARLLAWQDRLGLYAYPVHPDGQTLAVDLSNTLFATLALRAAARLGIEVEDKVWEGLIRGTLRCHEDTDTDRSGQTPARRLQLPGGRPTCDRLDDHRRFERAPDRARSPGSGVSTGVSRRSWTSHSRAAWPGSRPTWIGLATPGADGWQFFYLYGVERLGSLLGRGVIGKFDWYRSGSEYLIAGQGEDGRWQGGGQASRQGPRHAVGALVPGPCNRAALGRA